MSGFMKCVSAALQIILRRSSPDYPLDAILGRKAQLPGVSGGTCDLQYRFNILIRIFN